MTEAEFESLWKNLVMRVHGTEGPPLSKQERHFYAVNLLRGSVPRSGFIGYFENWSGREIADAFEGLAALRLQSVLALLERASRIVFEGRPIPIDSSPIAIFPDSLTEAEYDQASKQMDEALTPIEVELCELDEQIWAALCDHADAHLDLRC